MLYAVLTQRDGHSSADSEPGSAILKRSLTLSLTNPKAILFMSHSSCSLLTSAPKRPGWRSLSRVDPEIISFIYMSFLILSGSFVTRYVKTKKKLAKIGNSLIGLVFVGFAARLATLQS